MELLLQLNQEGMTIIMVTHSPDCAGYAQRILRVADGKLKEDHSNLRRPERRQEGEEKDFIRNKLQPGLTVDQVVNLVDTQYGHKII